MFRIAVRGINDIDLPRDYFVVETPKVAFHLKTLSIIFDATNGERYIIDFNEKYNQFIACGHEEDKTKQLNDIFKVMANKQTELMDNGSLDLTSFGAKLL